MQGESCARVNTAKVVWREEQLGQLKVSAEELQPIRFQGQSFDTETGLHYNRFRYFDPDLGMFTTRDPIGLLGGSNVFQYAPNPTGWVDPFGLSGSNLSALDQLAIDASNTLPERTRSAVTVAVGRGESGQLYVSTSEPSTRRNVQNWAKDNNITVVNSKTKGVHAEESLHNFAPEKMQEIGSSKPICLDCETGMRNNDIDFNESHTSDKQSRNRKNTNNHGCW